MKMITVMIVCAALQGCSAFSGAPEPAGTTPNQKLVLEDTLYAMSRSETIDAIKECETSGLRAVPIWTKRSINGRPTSIVVDVTCAPKWMR